MTVKQRQALLFYLGYYTGSIDGSWGTLSKTACKAFQKDFGITVDGVCGQETEKALKHAVAYGIDKKTDSTGNSTDNNTDSTNVQNNNTGTFWDGIKYFKRDEFRCPCGKCGGFPVEPQEALVRVLETIREHFNAPITIVPLPPADGHSGGSGVRCAEYNATLSGSVSNSRHLQGKAADIIVRGFSGSSVKTYCDYLVSIGKLRYCYVIGGGNSVHVDIL